MKNFLILIFLLTSNYLFAEELGQVVSVDKNSGDIRFYIGDLDINVGEKLEVYNSMGVLDIKVVVRSVEAPYAVAEFLGLNRQGAYLEKMNVQRKVKLVLDKNKNSYAGFFVGPSYSKAVGDFGGMNYGLGLVIVHHLPWWTEHELLWSLQLQADDLGKDSSGTGKRVSYYMLGIGKDYKGVQYMANIGIADNMTMPKGGSTVVDPYTGAAYPDNVEHVNRWGYLFSARYPFVMSVPTRNKTSGWSISPGVTYGKSFSSSGYGETVSLMVYLGIEANEMY